MRNNQNDIGAEGLDRRRVLKNSISSLMIYAFLLLFSVVSSKFVLVSYGSEINGLLSSVNQLFSYIALLEAGIGASTVSALYRPISEKDEEGIARILSASRHYYRTSAKWYFLCVIVVSCLWPLVIQSTIGYGSIFLLIFLQGVSGVITYWFTSSAVNYLLAQGINFINNRVHLFATLLTYVLKILICAARINIVFISAASIAVNALQCLIYYFYLRKHCPICFVKKSPDKFLLPQRGAFLVHEISGVIFSSTDTILLSVFCSLTDASVYAVYSMVTNALRTIIGQVFNGTNYILGNSYADADVRYEVVHDRYNAVYQCMAFSVFTIAYYLSLPFLTLYTKGITDANYLDPKLPVLFILIELLSTCRAVDNQLVRISLHARQTMNRAIIEATINIVISVAAVQFVGIYGVLLGTIAALLYRTNDFILYANRKILKRSPKKEYVLVLTNFVVFLGFALLREYISLVPSSYLELVGIAVPVGVAIVIVYAAINYGMERFILRKMV